MYEDESAGASSRVVYLLLEVITWTTEIAVCKQANACEYPFVLSAADHQRRDAAVYERDDFKVSIDWAIHCLTASFRAT